MDFAFSEASTLDVSRLKCDASEAPIMVVHPSLLQALVTVKDKLRDVEGPDMREGMQDQIRQWFLEVR